MQWGRSRCHLFVQQSPRPSTRSERGKGAFWKTPEIVAWAKAGRSPGSTTRLPMRRVWVNEHHSGPALLHRVDPRCGLTSNDIATLTAWATELC